MFILCMHSTTDYSQSKRTEVLITIGMDRGLKWVIPQMNAYMRSRQHTWGSITTLGDPGADHKRLVCLLRYPVQRCENQFISDEISRLVTGATQKRVRIQEAHTASWIMGNTWWVSMSPQDYTLEWYSCLEHLMANLYYAFTSPKHCSCLYRKYYLLYIVLTPCEGMFPLLTHRRFSSHMKP